MASPITQMLKLNSQEKRNLGRFLGHIKGVNEFLDEAFEAFKEVDFARAVEEALPWAGAFAEALGEAIPPVKFLVKLFSKLTEQKDPDALAYLACTFAYQRAVEQTIKTTEVPKGPRRSMPAEVKKDLLVSEEGLHFDFERFSFGSALLHPFVKRADVVLESYLEAAGYSDEQRRVFVGEVHQRFVPGLKSLLTHGETREQFLPVTERMGLGAKEYVAFEALLEHAEYQRWLFEEKPVFGKEPFSLAQVYIDTECGQLSWGEVRDGVLNEGPQGRVQRIDPFLEVYGGRRSLGQTVMELLADPGFRDAIVVQGPAGAGKSAFTLWLCAELVRRGLRPIRVLLRDLRLERTRPVAEALAQAVRLTEEAYQPEGLPYPRPEDLFNGGQIFRERIRLGRAIVCPYVLVLDGWDEISVSVSEGFKLRLDRMLENLRTEFIHNQEVPIRIILTGRPSTAVTDSSFLYKSTQLLTVRPLSPEQLEQFVQKLSGRLRNLPADHISGWKFFEVERFKSAFARYREDFEARGSGEKAGTPNASTGSLEVLGLPLLTHLAVRLLVEPDSDMESLIANPTSLYRSLVDLTCAKSGKYIDAQDDIDQQYRISGGRLRDLLRRTAFAMTVHGKESISYEELRLRLNQVDLARAVQNDLDESDLAQLMISYYFKGGHVELGCEFLHKSFREYLFSEGIVEILKAFGRAAVEDLAQRSPYWKEFDEADPRFRLSRELSQVLAPQWLSGEIVSHLQQLLSWEIARSHSSADRQVNAGHSTAVISLESWKCVRDGLADLWDWWCEGVHLRPQPSYDKRQKVEFDKPYAQDLVEWAMPLDLERGAPLPEPPRLVTSDAHLGDSLFRLTAWVHWIVAIEDGYLRSRDLRPLEMWKGVSNPGNGPRHCQAIIPNHEDGWVLFSPSGRSPSYFHNYMSRINGAGWRPAGAFPLGCDLTGVDLRNAAINIPTPPSPPSVIVVWDYANLSGATAVGGLFWDHSFRCVLASDAYFWRGLFGRADFSGADFSQADLGSSNLRDAILVEANLARIKFEEADLRSADFRGSDLSHANLTRANLQGADLRFAILSNAKLDTNLTGANLDSTLSDHASSKESRKGDHLVSPRRGPSRQA